MQKAKLLTEFLGTFFLATVVALTGNPLAIGAVLMILVYGGGHISGAHFNPAVTFAFFLQQKISAKESLFYIISQFAGAILAALLYVFSTRLFFVAQPAAQTPFLTAFLVEVVFTFLLVRTILSVAADTRVKGNQYFGLAIGGALFVGAVAGGPISGGAFNPAVGVGPLLLNPTMFMNHLPLVGLYILGPVIGAAVAAKLPNLIGDK
jgi:aquaporin Z